MSSLPKSIHWCRRYSTKFNSGWDIPARHPFFSPDGEWLAFFADGKLKKISLAGGAPLTLAELNTTAAGADWGSNDAILYNDGTELLRVPAAGGAPEVLLAPEPGEPDHYRWPEILPGGDAVLYTAWRGSLEQTAIAVFSETTGESRVLVEPGTHSLYTTSGHLVFARAPNALWAVPFDLGRLDITGSLFRFSKTLLYTLEVGRPISVSRTTAPSFTCRVTLRIPNRRSYGSTVTAWLGR